MSEETLFALALRAPEAERAALLDRECASNPDLRARVEALLQADADSGDFLPAIQVDETAPYSGSPGTSRSEQPGTVIAGKYKLVKQIGHGAMGAVWMAEQSEPVKRQVAVKLILADRFQSRNIVARFEAERQAIALMDHPHIARLFDAGTTADGAPFFVMQLIQGVGLTDYCDRHQLSVPDRLHLFMQICSAVQHAHQKGIIHRDLKPANILVESHDGKPVPKVIDFGLAKATGGLQLTEHSLSTHLDAVVGTPLYMAPEQATFNAVDVDTRADIYSLGVILYELLTGSTPIEREQVKEAALDEVLRLIREQEPPTPSKRLSTTDSGPSVAANRHTEPAKLTRLVHGDLDWVVMKALEKDRNRRYETANGFASDIERFLNHEPVNAVPPTVRYRLRKFVKRNKGPVVAGGLVLLTLLVGMAGTTFGLVRAESRRLDAERARGDEAEQRAFAVAEQEKAEVAQKKAEAAEVQTLEAYRASTDDAIERLIGSNPALGEEERAYLEKTLKRWQRLADRQGDDERSQEIRAEGHSRVANLWAMLGRSEEAMTEFEVARDLREKLVKQFPGKPAYRQGLARIHNNLGLLLSGLGRRDAARLEFGTARDLQMTLVERFLTEPACQDQLATIHNNLGNLLAGLGERNAARVEYEKARSLRKRLVEQFPAEPAYQRGLAGIHNNLGHLLANPDERRASRLEYDQARDLQTTLVEQFPDVPTYKHELAGTHHNLGIRLREIGEPDAAQLEYKKARDLETKLVEQFPAAPAFQQRLASIHHSFGMLLAYRRQRAAAQEEYERARDLQAKLVDRFPNSPDLKWDLAATHTSLGSLQNDLGRPDAARKDHERARDLQIKLVKQFPAEPRYQRELAGTHNNLGDLFADGGQTRAAQVEYGAARDLQTKLVEQFPDQPTYQQELAATLHKLGFLLADIGKWNAARVEFETARDLKTNLVERFPDEPAYQQGLAATFNSLGLVYSRVGKLDAARKEYERACDTFKKLVEQSPAERDNQLELGGAYCNLGDLVRFEGKPAESLFWFEKSIATLETLCRAEPRNTQARQFLRNCHGNRAMAYHALKQYAEAVKDWDRAIQFSPAAQRGDLRASRAHSLVLAGQVAEAVAEVAELTKSSNWGAVQWHKFACVYAAANGKVADRKQEYADRAMVLLRQAIQAGFKDAAQMKKDVALDPLRDRADFKKLLTDLEAKTEPAPPPKEKK